MTEYFDLAPEVQYWFTSSGSNNGKFSLNGSILSWTSGDVTSDGCDFQVKQGITWDKWSSQDSVAVGQQTISSNASLNVVQERVSQPDFNGTASLPVETAQPGDTIAAVLKNFTDYDRADVRWQWQRNPLGFWEDIPGATEMSYTVTDEDQDCHLRLCYNVGMGTDVHGMFTNEVTCGKTYAGEVSLTVSSNAIELDEAVVLTFTARNADGTPGEGFVQLRLDGNEHGEPVAVEAGVAQFTLSGEDMGIGNHTVYAVFQSEDLAPKVTGEQAITVNKIDLSGLLITNVPENTSVYYRGGKKAQWHYITVSYDPENWPEGFAFSQSNLKITAYRNGQWGGSSGEQQITRYVTVSSTEVTCGANLAYTYALKVEINDARYTGSITTGILTVQKSPLNVKVRDIYATTGETINLGFDLIDDGITSFGLQGDDFLNRYAVITYTVTNQQGEDVTGQLQSLEPGEYTVRMSMPAAMSV